jgi:ATP-dependent Clp protease protease subunit
MSLRKLPEVKAFSKPDGYQWDAPGDVLSKWTPLAAEADQGATISVYDVIGYDSWTGEGFTAKRMAGALRAIGEKPVEVLINSPGGDMFEGLAIYNLLREHPAEVTVKVMGMAASAASIIAMAADNLLMGKGAFLMIHNSWGVVVGNQNDMRDAASVFAEFDAAMAEIYESRSGLKLADIESMMDAETWLRASEAVAKGLADGTTDDDYKTQASGERHINARRRLDAILAEAKMPRSERRALLKEAAGTHDAASLPVTPSADHQVTAALASLLATIRA